MQYNPVYKPHSTTIGLSYAEDQSHHNGWTEVLIGATIGHVRLFYRFWMEEESTAV